MPFTRRRLLASLGGSAVVGSAGCLDGLGSSTLINADFESRGQEWDRRGGTRDEESTFDYSFRRTNDRAFRRSLSLQVDTDALDADGAAWIVREVPLDHNYDSFTMSVAASADPDRRNADVHIVSVFTDEDVVGPKAFPGAPDRPATADGETYGGFRQSLAQEMPDDNLLLDEWITDEGDGWVSFEREVNWISDIDRSVGYFAVGVSASQPGRARTYLDDIRLVGSY